MIDNTFLKLYITLGFQNPPNTLPSQEVFVGPNTCSQGIWKTIGLLIVCQGDLVTITVTQSSTVCP